MASTPPPGNAPRPNQPEPKSGVSCLIVGFLLVLATAVGLVLLKFLAW